MLHNFASDGKKVWLGKKVAIYLILRNFVCICVYIRIYYAHRQTQTMVVSSSGVNIFSISGNNQVYQIFQGKWQGTIKSPCIPSRFHLSTCIYVYIFACGTIYIISTQIYKQNSLAGILFICFSTSFDVTEISSLHWAYACINLK